MDPKRLEMLAGHVDFDACRFDISLQDDQLFASLNGLLRGPSVTCSFIATVACDDSRQVNQFDHVRLELDMLVTELAGLEADLSRLARAKPGELVDLWIDRSIADAWNALSEDDTLQIVDGSCVFKAVVAASDASYMQRIVDLISAVADAPVRRAAELAAGLSRFECLRVAQRLQLGADAVVVVHDGRELVVGASHDRKRGLCTSVRCEFVGERAPSTDQVVVIDGQLHVPLLGWITDPEQLAAAIALAAELCPAIATPPYR